VFAQRAIGLGLLLLTWITDFWTIRRQNPSDKFAREGAKDEQSAAIKHAFIRSIESAVSGYYRRRVGERSIAAMGRRGSTMSNAGTMSS
jgi:hypothetical protein